MIRHKFNIVRFYILLISFGCTLCASSVNFEEEIHHQDVIDLINEVKNNLDSTADPCTDFEKYACGNTKKFGTYIEVINQFIEANKPTNNQEEIVYKLFKDCDKSDEYVGSDSGIRNAVQQIDYLKHINNFPVGIIEKGKYTSTDVGIIEKGKYTSTDVAQLEAFINSLGFSSLFTLSLNDSTILTTFNETETLDVKTIFYNPSFFWRKFEETARFNGTETALQETVDFMNKLKSVLEKKTNNPVNNFDVESNAELKNIIPSTAFDWDVFYRTLEQMQVIGQSKHFKIQNIALFKELIEFLDSYDIETIINYQLYQLVKSLETVGKCRILSEVITPTLVTRIMKEIWNDRTIERYTNAINEFEHDYEEMKKLVLSAFGYNIAYLRSVPDRMRNASFFDNEDTLKFYSDYGTNQYYKAAVSYLQKKVLTSFYKRTHIFKLKDIHSKNDLRTYFYKYVPLKNKPILYFNNVFLYDLWAPFNGGRDMLYDSIIQSCFKQIKESGRLFVFMARYSTIKILQNFKGSKDLLNKEMEWTKDLIKPEQLSFLLQAQYVCKVSPEEFYDYIAGPFRHLEEFSNAFSCPKNSNMNKYENNVCEVADCPKYPAVILNQLPFTFKGCSS